MSQPCRFPAIFSQSQRPLDGAAPRPAASASDEEYLAELARQAAAAPHESGTGLFAEFRRKLASGEALSRAVARLAEALRFTGRVTLSFHQGRLTKAVLEESYFPGSNSS